MTEQHAFVELPGCALSFRDAGGSGRPVLLLHGAGLDHRMFAEQFACLRDAGLRPIAPDLRGHGESRPNLGAFTATRLAEDIEALIAHLALERPALVGLSLGGNLAQLLVRRDPEPYAGLAVLDAAWNAGELRRRDRLAIAVSTPLLRLVPAPMLPGMFARASAVTPEARRLLCEWFATLSKPEFLAVWRAIPSFLVAEPSYRTPLPLLLMRGEHDTTGTISSVMPDWAVLEGTRETVIEDAGHVVTIENAHAVNEALLAFLLMLR